MYLLIVYIYINKQTQKSKAMTIGQYTVTDEDFRFRYLVYKIMPKTVEVSTLTSWKDSDFKGERHYRYPLEFLEQQIIGADYLPFKT